MTSKPDSQVPSSACRSRFGEMHVLLDAVADARRGRLHGILEAGLHRRSKLAVSEG